MKRQKKRIGFNDYLVLGGMALFMLSSFLCIFDSRFTPLVLAVWGILFVTLIIWIGIGTHKLYKPRYCPKCGTRLRLPLFPEARQTVKAKCRNCGHGEDTGVALPEVRISD
jgi:hypothetical protein